MKKLRVGDWVEVRSKEEILSTLDKQGRMEGLPFMPQMFQYCGKKFQVYKSAHKTCDWVYTVKSRTLPKGIHLNIRCDGAAYGSCQTACLLYWKEVWLKPVDETISVEQPSLPKNKSICNEADVLASTHFINEQKQITYACQATEVFNFTKPLSPWDFRQYLKDYTSGNAGIDRLLRGLVYSVFYNISRIRGLGRILRWFYDLFEFVWGPNPRRRGKIPPGQPTPACELNLQPGELVRIKSYNEILATLNSVESTNRGLYFDGEMVPYCGKVCRVKARVTTFIDEKTGKLITLKNPSLILEDVVCQGRYSRCRMMCPRAIYAWWREIWLERVTE
jgi:hypothetical protein